MRIAQVAPLYESVPPKLYGGTERVVSYLTEELVRVGHDVTLFASGDSETTARLVPACPRALWRDPKCRETLPHHVRLMELVFHEARKFDVIHFHGDYLHFPLLRRHATPGVTTLHGRVHLHDLQPLFDEFRKTPLVSISDSQRRPLPEANWQATVYHGLPRDLHTFRQRREITSCSSGGSHPKKGSTALSRSRAEPGGSLRWPRRSMTRTVLTTRIRSNRFSVTLSPSLNSLARSAAKTKIN